MSKRHVHVRQLDDGLIGTFIWFDSIGRLCVDSWLVTQDVTRSEPPSSPRQASITWLKPFIGRPVGDEACVAAPEGNIVRMQLVSVVRPRKDGLFDQNSVLPAWLKNLTKLKEEACPQPNRSRAA